LENSELSLRYGTNPHQTPARVFIKTDYVKSASLPLRVLSGNPGYINLLDALNGWQLVRELGAALSLPAAASFKHVSPAGAAVGVPLEDVLRQAYSVEDIELSPLAAAYARARGADRVSSFGDFVALSEIVDISTARLLRREVSDGVIAPGFTDEALSLLRGKQKGKYLIIEMDPAYEPPMIETREVFGITFEQKQNDVRLSQEMLSEVVTRNKDIPEAAQRDLLVALIALKYTQSNSVCLALDGQVIGMGAGQQSRILCTRLAASKADTWFLRQHPAALNLPFRQELSRTERDNAVDLFLRDDLSSAEEQAWAESFAQVPTRLTEGEKYSWLETLRGVSLGSDGFIPFRDNIDRAARSGVRYVAQPGHSVRDSAVIEACDEYGIVMAFTGTRLFHH
jgi:phosphoribosylaminoimidazolecarboxamide formyltransferase/IMP cyclohydrolase